MEMCQQEGISLQKGMNFKLHGSYSVILMSIGENAPYKDQITNDGTMLIYEGHDIPKTHGISDPKKHDQMEFRPSGSLTENGKFHKAAQDYKKGKKSPRIVRVYEKIKPGIWSDNWFISALLIRGQRINNGRIVFKFKLVIMDDFDGKIQNEDKIESNTPRTRLIPTAVKIEVWKRDKGKCVICGATDELHFDHIIPYSKGGTSLKAENIQLLCIRHNLEKKDKIE